MSRIGAKSPGSLISATRRSTNPSATWSPARLVNVLQRWRGRDDELFPLLRSERSRAVSFDARPGAGASPSDSPASSRLRGVGALSVAAAASSRAAREEARARRAKRLRFGLYAQYFAVGVVYGGLPSTIYGFFLGYLNVEAYVYATASTIIALPWSFKFAFGAINDCVPIFGERRRPYIILGWVVCAASLWCLALVPLPEPYWCAAPGGGAYVTEVDRPDGTGREAARPCNAAAARAGAPFALWMMLASLGYCVSDVAADGLTVTLARREPEGARGHTQTSVYLVRSVGNIVAVAFVGLCMNGWQYNGSFEEGLSFSGVAAAFAAVATVMIPLSYLYVSEPPTDAPPLPEKDALATPNLTARVQRTVSFASYRRSVWSLLRSKAMFYCVLYQFLTPLVGSIFTTAGAEVKLEWAGVRALQNATFSLVGLVLFTLGLWLVKRKLLDRSWRAMTLVTSVFLNVVDMPFSFCTIYGVVRNQYFYLGEAVLTESRPAASGQSRARGRPTAPLFCVRIPAAINFVVSTFVIVEMADGGDEGIVYGLLTTTYNIGTPFAQAISNQLFGLFKPSLSDAKNYVEDTDHFRNVVALSFVISYFFTFASLATLPLLPDQKADAQDRKLNWERRDAYAYASVTLVAVGILYSVSLNVLAILPETSCLEIAGGPGCASDLDAHHHRHHPR